ncbi:baseplate J/gp47 family protein [Paenibacillus melissococcoides]|uniref:baseplate J/gp47 family protein n=1 Tax=Paenibacillus melissococcoides TaxID=2912268 RepID=UPI0036F23574
MGIKRFQEEFAYGELTFIGTPEYTIPEGTIVGTATGKYFVTNEDLTLDNDGKGGLWDRGPRSGNRMERLQLAQCGFAHPDANILSVQIRGQQQADGSERRIEEFRARVPAIVAGGGAASSMPCEDAITVVWCSSGGRDRKHLLTTRCGRQAREIVPVLCVGSDEQEIAAAISQTKAGVSKHTAILFARLPMSQVTSTRSSSAVLRKF